MSITAQEAIAELRREIKTRERVYPNWIEAGKLTEKVADHRTECLRWTLAQIEAANPPPQGSLPL